jgi:hypothetical protein
MTRIEPLHRHRGSVDRQGKRRSVVAEIQRTRLGGADRITLDMLPEEPFAQYAHIYRNSLGVSLHTTDDPSGPDDVYGDDPNWERLGVIDLDSGNLADA